MMKKIIAIVALTSIVIGLGHFTLAEEKKYQEGYKGAKWGMNKEEVKKAFSDMIFKEDPDGTQYFLSEIANEKVMVGFLFVNDKLYKALIMAQIATSNNSTYINAFNKFEELLTQKYGKPKQKIRNGSTNQFMDDAMAISTGVGGYADTWMTPESTIMLMLKGDNYRLSLAIMYQSNELSKEADVIEKKKSIDSL
jgi:hypothetical protein